MCVVVIQDLILQLHAVSESWEGTAIVTLNVTDTTTAVQICVRLTASVSYNTYAIPARTCSQAGISGCTHSHKKKKKKNCKKHHCSSHHINCTMYHSNTVLQQVSSEAQVVKR